MSNSNVINAFRAIDGSITGRDNYIMAKALAYAILTIERLPECWRENGDLQDMRLMLFALAPNERFRSMVHDDARRHILQVSAPAVASDDYE